ncbi:MAG: ATP-binding protein [Lawsonibacter sp.]|jgi:uncharacterized protein YhaN
MKIHTLTATFGKLEKQRLELGPGLNLIQAPNEGGKSTWCAFWKAMLYGIDTRDRDKKGYLADKNRYQPWSGAPMEGVLELEWQGQDITLRRGPKGNVPFGAFSAVYTTTGESVPALNAATCGTMLTGVEREVFERSAFLGGGVNLAVTSTPELEKRIAALVSSGQEDVSYSQTLSVLREWSNRRRVNRSVGLIPKLEGELQDVRNALGNLEDLSSQIAELEEEHAKLSAQYAALSAQVQLHRRLAQQQLDMRWEQAQQDLEVAQQQVSALEEEGAKFGPLPEKEQLKQAQGELQYLKVLEDEIRQGSQALKQAEEAYTQAQIAAQDPLFPGLSEEEAGQQVRKDLQEYTNYENTARAKDLGSRFFPLFGLLITLVCLVVGLVREGSLFSYPLYVGLVALVLSLLAGLVAHSNARDWRRRGNKLLARYQAQTPEEVQRRVDDYTQRCRHAEQAATQLKTIRGALNDRQARHDNSRADLMAFVHRFAPQVRDLFGCSAALSRALNFDHEQALARERLEERRRRLEDLTAQGATAPTSTLDPLPQPNCSLADATFELQQVTQRLEQVGEDLNRALGRQTAMGDPAALSARREELEQELEQRNQELDALALAMDTLARANTRLQERFSPELTRQAGEYFARLTGQRYTALTLNRELEGSVLRPSDVLPRSALSLSKGTVDQLYLAVRLAVCRLCLPQRPPIVLDDALLSFDQERLGLALELLEELSQEQQILLFTCQNREAQLLGSRPGLTSISLS